MSKFIDKDGKVFGKINIIDLLIILVIVVALLVTSVRMILGALDTPDVVEKVLDTQRVRVTFYGGWVNDFLPDALTIGDPVELYNSNVEFGELESFSVEQAYSWQYDEDSGELVKVPAVGYCYLTFTVVTTGHLDEKGLAIDDFVFVVGGNYYINIGPTRAGYQIMDLEGLGKATRNSTSPSPSPGKSSARPSNKPDASPTSIPTVPQSSASPPTQSGNAG